LIRIIFRNGDVHMFGKLLGGYVGHRIGERYANNGLKGTLVGLGASAVARRGVGPLALLVGGAWVAKKVLNRRGGRTATTTR
jgi:hypothetical protein